MISCSWLQRYQFSVVGVGAILNVQFSFHTKQQFVFVDLTLHAFTSYECLYHYRQRSLTVVS